MDRLSESRPYIVVLAVLFLFTRDPAAQQKPSRLDYQCTLADVWGRVFLFHPSVSDSAKRLNFYLPLMEALTAVDSIVSPREFVNMLNRVLLLPLGDPLTYAYHSGYKANSAERLSDAHRLRASVCYDDGRTWNSVGDTVILDLRFPARLDSAVAMRRLSRYVAPRSHAYRGVREHFGWYERGASKTVYLQYLAIDTLDLEVHHDPPPPRCLVVLVNNASVNWVPAILEIAADSNLALVWEATGEFQKTQHTYPGGISLAFNFRLPVAQVGTIWQVPLFQCDRVQSIDDLLRLLRPRSASNFFRPYTYRAPSVNEDPMSLVSRFEVGFAREERLVGLIKIWNVMRYFHPNLENAQKDWDAVLPAWIPILESTGRSEYMFQIAGILADLKDSHMGQHLGSGRSGANTIPLRFETVRNGIFVAESGFPEVHPGDELIELKGESIAQIEASWKLLKSLSRSESLRMTLFGNRFRVGEVLTGQPDRSLSAAFLRHGDTVRVSIPSSVPAMNWEEQALRGPYELSDDSILYMMPSAFERMSDIERTIRAHPEATGMIVDLRGVGNVELLPLYKCLATQPLPSPLFSTPVVRHDRTRWNKHSYESPASPDAFRGKVVVLTEGHLISAWENLCMTLRNAGRAKFVGRTTMGCNGVISEVFIIRGRFVWFTGMKTEFADGSSFAGVGVVPDFPVEPTVQGLIEGRDEALEKAYAVLRGTP